MNKNQQKGNKMNTQEIEALYALMMAKLATPVNWSANVQDQHNAVDADNAAYAAIFTN